MGTLLVTREVRIKRGLVLGSTPGCRLICQLDMAAITDANGLKDAEMWERECLAGALLIEAVSTVAAVMLPVGKGECSTAAHADV